MQFRTRSAVTPGRSNPFETGGLLIMILAILCVGHPARAQVIHVPEDYETIQGAIEAAEDFYEIIVAPGSYHEAIDLLGKRIWLHSSEGSEVTTIDATGLETSVVTCTSGETAETVVEGFTITGGTGTWDLLAGAYLGGGVFISESSLSMQSCRLFKNEAEFGGALYARDCPIALNIRDCAFLENLALEIGGGIRLVRIDGATDIRRCEFVGNVGGDGGGLAITDGREVELADSVFRDNLSAYSFYNEAGGGGAIHLVESNVVAGRCTFDANTSLTVGGALFAEGSLDATIRLLDCQFISNVCATNGGGALITAEAAPVMDGCTFSGNMAASGGGCWMAGSLEEPQFMECTFEGNVAWSGDGGGLYSEGESIDVRHSRFASNMAWYGGGMWVRAGMCTQLRFEQNEARGSGGGLWLGEGDCSHSSFVENVAGDTGGGLFTESADCFGSEFLRNTCLDGGGGMRTDFGRCEQCTFIGNQALWGSGGGLNTSDGPCHNSTFIENSAQAGGAVRAPDPAATISNCLMLRNEAWGYGGAIRGPATIAHCTIVDCVSDAGGGAFYAQEGTGTSIITGTIFWHNSQPQIFNSGSDDEVVIEMCLIDASYPGWGNISADPQFVNPEEGNYALGPHSPCIDAALDTDLETDLNGHPRWVGAFVDMGAYERQEVEHRFILREPRYGVAGEFNDFFVGGTTPGAVAYLVWGLQGGSTFVPECEGVTLDIAAPTIFADPVSDEHGFAVEEVEVPAIASGRRILFQAVDHEACRVSNLVEYVFE